MTFPTDTPAIPLADLMVGDVAMYRTTAGHKFRFRRAEVTATTKTTITVQVDGKEGAVRFTRNGYQVGAPNSDVRLAPFDAETYVIERDKEIKDRAISYITGRLAELEKMVRGLGIDPASKYREVDYSEINLDDLQRAKTFLGKAEAALLGMPT